MGLQNLKALKLMMSEEKERINTEDLFFDEDSDDFELQKFKYTQNLDIKDESVVVPDESLTDEQNTVIETTLKWFEDGESPVLTIGGLAGTGKTTVMRKIYDRLSKENLNIGVGAFTGKAASVLRRKGVPGNTIHSMIYELIEVPGGDPIFELRYTVPYGLLFLDEASMIGKDLDRDIRSFDIPIIYVGDHGQLEPIKKDSMILKNPDLRLEQIHRNAGCIAHFSNKLRVSSSTFPEMKNDEVYVGTKSNFTEKFFEADIAICGYNNTRHALNIKKREHLGYKDKLPEVGEPLMCLRNNRRFSTFNGMVAKVTEVLGIYRGNLYLNLEDDLGNTWENIPTWTHQYGNNHTQSDPINDTIPPKRGVTYFDWAYAITCHKAQGSEYNRVAVYEEIYRDKWDAKRWRYTAASRAKQFLFYAR